jgi:hypothetical protein
MNYNLHIAIHEAGHAIAAIELEIAFEMISIEPSQDTAGRIGVEGDDGYWFGPGRDSANPSNDKRFQQWADEQAIIDYAGHAAIVTLLGESAMNSRAAVRAGAGTDFKKASRRLGSDRRRIAAAKARALEIVGSRRDDVRKIADTLLQHGRLCAQQVDWLLLRGLPFPDSLMYGARHLD